jgi:hypothetical protein
MPLKSRFLQERDDQCQKTEFFAVSVLAHTRTDRELKPRTLGTCSVRRGETQWESVLRGGGEGRGGEGEALQLKTLAKLYILCNP